MTTDTPTAPEGVLLYVDPKCLHPDPLNTRGELRNIPELAESMKSSGVLEAITVRPIEAKDGSDEVTDYIISRGHRRHAAALLAGLPVVPIIVKGGDDDLERAFTRLVENLQRDDFTPSEEAKGVQQLLDFGTDIETIATQLAVPIERVRGAAAIAGSKFAWGIVAKHTVLTFDQALALVEFDSDKAILKELTATALKEPDDFPHILAQVRQEKGQRLAVAEAATEWKAKGYKVLAEQPKWADKTTTNIEDLAVNQQKKTTKLTEATHAECPGRAVWIYARPDASTYVRHFCVGATKFGHVPYRGNTNSGGSRSSGSKAPAVDEKAAAKATLERRQHRAALNAGRAAQEVRRAYILNMVNRKVSPAGTLRFATNVLMTHTVTDCNPQFRELTGSNPAASKGWSTQSGEAINAQRTFVKDMTEARLPLALFARVAAHIEANWEPNTWDISKGAGRDLRTDYLKFLIATGYTPALIEKVLLGQAKPQAVLDEADRIKALGKTAAPTAAPPALPPGKPATATKKTAAKTAAKKAVRRAPARPRTTAS
jgi:ParB family chromosome partitioning protein